MKSGIDVVRHVWCEDYSGDLIVRPFAENPKYVQILPEDEESKKFWGDFELTMPAEMALKLAGAIAACAREQIAEQIQYERKEQQ